MKFSNYHTDQFFDEMFHPDGTPRPAASRLLDKIHSLPEGEMDLRQRGAEAALYDMGITFTVYHGNQGTDRIFPFDIIPRIVPHSDWIHIERGLKQRIVALRTADFANDHTGDGSDVRPTMASYRRFIAHAAQRYANELAPHRPSDRLSE